MTEVLMSDETTTVGCGLPGCVMVIVALIILWAILFGVTVGGQHYGLDCSCDQGVQVEGFDENQRTPGQ